MADGTPRPDAAARQQAQERLETHLEEARHRLRELRAHVAKAKLEQGDGFETQAAGETGVPEGTLRELQELEQRVRSLERALEQSGADAADGDPGVESVVGDLQPVVVTDLSGTGEPDPPAQPAATVEPGDSVLDQIREDGRAQAEQSENAQEIADLEQQVQELERQLESAQWQLSQDQDVLEQEAATPSADDFVPYDTGGSITFDADGTPHPHSLAPQRDVTQGQLRAVNEDEGQVAQLERALAEARRRLDLLRTVGPVVPDLQPIVEIGPGDPSAWTPAESPAAAKPRVPGGTKTVVAGGVIGVAALGVVLAVALGGGSKTQASAAAAAPTTTAAAVAPAATEPPAAAGEPPTVTPISAVFTKRPPPKQKTSCGFGCLTLKPVTVRYTTYRVSATNPAGGRLTYRWHNTNPCGTFVAKGASAIWSFPHPGTCPNTEFQAGTISVTASDGKRTCTASYPSGSAAGRGPQPVCKPR